MAGVAPPGFFGVDPAAAPDFYVPLHADYLVLATDPHGAAGKDLSRTELLLAPMMARLRPGVSLAQAQAALAPAVSPVGRDHRGERPGSARIFRRSLIQEGAAGLDSLRRQYLEAAVRAADAGGLDPGDRLRQHREPAAGARRRAPARNGGAAQHGRGTLPRDPPTSDGERPAGVAGGVLGVVFAIWGSAS